MFWPLFYPVISTNVLKVSQPMAQELLLWLFSDEQTLPGQILCSRQHMAGLKVKLRIM